MTATSRRTAPLRIASSSMIARPSPSGSPLATCVSPVIARAVALTRKGRSSRPANWTVIGIRWPARTRSGARTSDTRVSGGGRPTAIHCTGNRASCIARSARAVSPAFSRPSEIITTLSNAACACAARAASNAASIFVAEGWRSEAEPAGSADGAPALPANSRTCTSPLPAAFSARTTSASAASPAARGTLSERSTSTSTCALLRGSSQETPSRDSESTTSAANCSASAIKVLAAPMLTWILRPLARSIGTTEGPAQSLPKAA